MRRVAVGMLVVFTMLGARSGAQELPPDVVAKTSCQEAIKVQNRINSYFHRGVVPNLMSCWSRLTGTGSVAVTFEFARKGDLWVPGPSYLRDSKSVSASDAQSALVCLQAAMVGTAFPVDETDLEATQFNVHWSFPVRWPRDLDDAAAVFLSNNPIGASKCGGSEGPAPACHDCLFNTTWHFSYCGSACVGWHACSVEDQYGCRMSATRCVTGSVFGNVGGIALY
jgi:hypothetical protein